MPLFFLLLLFITILLGERILFSRFWKSGVKSTLTFSSSVIEEGESVTVVEETVNSKRLPLPSVRIDWSLLSCFSPYVAKDGKAYASVSSFSVPGRSRVRRTVTIDGLERGYYTFTNGKITATDYFSTMEDSKTFSSFSSLHVLPGRKKGFHKSFPYRFFLGTVLSKRLSMTDPFEISGIREYRIGDNERDVNWKAFARTGRPMVNQRTWTTDESVIVIFDASSGTKDKREELIRHMYSFLSLLLLRGTVVSLFSSLRSSRTGRAIDVEAGSGIGHAGTIGKALSEAKTEAEGTEDVDALLSRSLSGDGKGVPVLFSVEKIMAEEVVKRGGAVFFLEGSGLIMGGLE